MRILLCLNDDLHSNLAFNLLFPHLKHHTLHIILSKGVGNSTNQIETLRLLEKDLPAQILFPFIQTQSSTSRYFTFQELPALHGISVRTLTNINNDEGLRYVTGLAPEVIISIRFGHIFKAPVIAIPPHGILNLHSGILPDYRGILATFWALLHEEKEIGCTLHYIQDATIDTGDIIGIHRLPTHPKRSLFGHIASLYEGGTAMVIEAVKKIEQHAAITTFTQDRSAGSYHSYPSQEEVWALLMKGYDIVHSEDYLALLKAYIPSSF